MRDLVNRFLTHKRHLVDTGELKARTLPITTLPAIGSCSRSAGSGS